ncbi:MAG: hypothetical protein ACP5D2_02905 [Candidatus Nanoarchaeia archaeon]
MKKQNKKVNKKIIIYSIIGFIFLGLVFIDWFFIIGAVVMMFLNQRELMSK